MVLEELSLLENWIYSTLFGLDVMTDSLFTPSFLFSFCTSSYHFINTTLDTTGVNEWILHALKCSNSHLYLFNIFV
jgi:hypothetical protein